LDALPDIDDGTRAQPGGRANTEEKEEKEDMMNKANTVDMENTEEKIWKLIAACRRG
jgi:adenylate kinase family enzyme